VRRRFGRTTLALALASATLLLAGCGSGSSSSPTATHTTADGMVMGGTSMPAKQPSDHPSTASDPNVNGGRGADGPSEAASMICGAETARAVRRNLDLGATPVGVHSWDHRIFTCTYPLPGGDLRLSVKDLDQSGPARDYFDQLRRRLGDATHIIGLASFGFPAVESPHGDVVFLKDQKTLWVDASRLRRRDLPSGESRQDVAYGVASAVIGCWTE
jgi:hypothetical protein